MTNAKYDVAVVGGGPGGSAAAKICAQGGLKTLLVEKRKLPRNKVCTGLIMSNMAQALVKEEFGDPPEECLTVPSHVSGIKFHAHGVDTQTLEHSMPYAWRRSFDNWLNQVAQGTGVDFWEKSNVIGIEEKGGSFLLHLGVSGNYRTVETRYLIGADGSISVVRKSLFPEAPMLYQLSVRYCYRASLDLDAGYVHYFALPDLTVFDVNFKEDVFLLEMGPRLRRKERAEILEKAKAWLNKEYGFTRDAKLLWRDGCLEPSLRKRPFSGPFPLAKGNALIVGNAAGLIKPVTGEGIGTAMKSGLFAGEAVIRASKTGKRAEHYYLPMANDMVSTLDTMYPEFGKMRNAAKKGMAFFLKEVRRIFLDTILVL